jgi:predicted permease
MLISKFRGLFRRRREDEEFDRELQSHLQMLVEDNLRRGMTPEEARRAALVRLGGVTQIKESNREQRGLPALDALATDFRYAVRTLRKSPGFTAVAILSLTLGIGANTAIFTLIDNLMLKSLAVNEPERLAVLNLSGSVSWGNLFSYREYQELRDDNQVFSGLLARDHREFPMRADGNTDLVQADTVSGNYFELLGLSTVIGRAITLQDDSPQATPVAVLDCGFWKRRFGADPGVLGKTIYLRDKPFTVIGILPAGFDGLDPGQPTDIYVPILSAAAQFNWKFSISSTGHELIGRLKPEVTREQAESSLRGLYRRIQERLAVEITGTDRSTYLAVQIGVEPGNRGFSAMRRRFSQPLAVLMALVGVVLLIACANMANLLLARATARRREMAVRVALGAGRGRLLRQSMTEALLLTCAGAALGLVLAQWGSEILVAALPDIRLQLAPDVRVLGFTLAISLLTGLLFSMAPAFHVSRTEAVLALKNHGDVRVTGAFALRKGLVLAQVALSVVLLAGAGLFVRTFQNWRNLDGKGERDHVQNVALWLPRPNAYSPGQWEQVFRGLLEHLTALPGVRAAAVGSQPLGWGNWSFLSVEGDQSRIDGEPRGRVDTVTWRYFETLGTTLLRGRTWSASEDSGRARVAVVNESFARRFFGGADKAIGRKLKFASYKVAYASELAARSAAIPDQFEIIGVAKDIKAINVHLSTPLLVDVPPMNWGAMRWLTVRTVGDPAKMVDTVRRVVEAHDRNLGVYSIHTLEEQRGQFLANERLMAWLAGFFGLLAAFLAAVGLYGVISFSVERRVREIGLRMALGARWGDILWLVLREILVLVAMGTAVGIPIALTLARFAKAMLFGVTPADGPAMSGAALLMCVVAVLAGYLPARRATRVDPGVALRCE